MVSEPADLLQQLHDEHRRALREMRPPHAVHVTKAEVKAMAAFLGMKDADRIVSGTTVYGVPLQVSND